jgi:Zn-dependent protease
MSAAGPLANLLLAALAFAVLAALGRPESDTQHAVARIAIVFLALNLLLFLFNLIPLPPLDGAGVVEGLVPKSRGVFDLMRQQPIFGLLTLLIAIKLVPEMFYPVFELVLGWLQALHR